MKNKQKFSLLGLIFLSGLIQAQNTNLVRDPGFDNNVSCMTSVPFAQNKSHDWGRTSNGSPDVIETNCAEEVAKFFAVQSYSSNGVGHGTNLPTNREFLTQKTGKGVLLKANHIYDIEFVALERFAPNGSNVEILLTQNSQINLNVANFTPNVDLTGAPDAANWRWTRYTGSFTAAEAGMYYITLGCFDVPTPNSSFDWLVDNVEMRERDCQENLFFQNQTFATNPVAQDHIASNNIFIGEDVTQFITQGPVILEQGSNINFIAGEEISVEQGTIFRAGSNTLLQIIQSPCNLTPQAPEQQFITNIDEVEVGFKVTVFPNPATSQINLNLSEAADGTVEIISLKGSIIKQQVHNGNSSIINIDELAPGIYFLKVTTDNFSEIKRFIKK